MITLREGDGWAVIVDPENIKVISAQLLSGDGGPGNTIGIAVAENVTRWAVYRADRVLRIGSFINRDQAVSALARIAVERKNEELTLS